VDRKRRFRSVLGRAGGDHYLGPGRRLLPGRRDSNALRTRKGSRHLLGRLTAVVAENPRDQGRTANPARHDARCGALSWLPRKRPRADTASAPQDHLGRVSRAYPKRGKTQRRPVPNPACFRQMAGFPDRGHSRDCQQAPGFDPLQKFKPRHSLRRPTREKESIGARRKNKVALVSGAGSSEWAGAICRRQ
jgi:hypothetical protein